MPQRGAPRLSFLEGDSFERRIERGEIHDVTDLVEDLFDVRVVITKEAWHAAVRLGGAARRLGLTVEHRARALCYQARCALANGKDEYQADVITDYAWTQRHTFEVEEDADGISIDIVE